SPSSFRLRDYFRHGPPSSHGYCRLRARPKPLPGKAPSKLPQRQSRLFSIFSSQTPLAASKRSRNAIVPFSKRKGRIQSVLGEREADRQTLQPADEHRFDARGLAREFEAFEARQQLLHQYPHLHAREMLAEADVRAKTEGDLLVLLAIGIEGEGVAEHILVAVGRYIVQHQPVAFADRLAA